MFYRNFSFILSLIFCDFMMFYRLSIWIRSLFLHLAINLWHGLPEWLRICLPMQKRHEMRVLPQVRKIPWRRQWQPTPVFLPGKFHGQRSLGGYSPWDCKESDMTEQLTLFYKIRMFGFNLTKSWFWTSVFSCMFKVYYGLWLLLRMILDKFHCF